MAVASANGGQVQGGSCVCDLSCFIHRVRAIACFQGIDSLYGKDRVSEGVPAPEGMGWDAYPSCLMDIPEHPVYIQVGIARPDIPGIVIHAVRQHVAHVRGYLQAAENEEIIALCKIK